MLPLLVLACLSGAPDDCETVTAGTWPDEAPCQAAGRAYLPAAGVSKQAWTCGTDGFWLAEVAPGVYVHKGAQAEPGPGNGGDTANIGFVIGDDAIAVIDAGGSDAVAGALLAGIRARSDLPVRWLVLTHMHPDHVMGAGMIAGQGAGVVAHPALAAGLAARYAHYHAAYARDIGPGWQAAEVPPEISPAPDEIDLGNRVLELRRHATGHTSNDLSVYDRRTGTWFLGDLVFLGHMPSIDGDLRGWQGAIAAAGERPADRPIVAVAAAGAIWYYNEDGSFNYGQSLKLQWGVHRPDGSYQALNEVDPIDVFAQQAWRNLRFPLDTAPPEANVARIVADDPNLSEEQWFGFTPPRVPVLQTADEFLGDDTPVLMDIATAANFPCQQPFSVRLGVAELPEYRILPNFKQMVISSNQWQSADDGGPLLFIQALLPRTSAIPTYLRGDWYRDWGAIERYYRAVPAQQAPDAAIEEGTTRVFGWSRGGPIRALP